MKEKYSDADLRRILSAETMEDQLVEQRIQETYELIRRKNSFRKKKTVGGKKLIWRFAAAAAALVLGLTICAMNPVMASGIPFVGSIFAQIQEIFPFGKAPEKEVRILENIEDHTVMNETVSPYQNSDQGITVTFTEYYATNQALFLGVKVESEEPFPDFVRAVDAGYQMLRFFTLESYDFMDDVVDTVRDVEGELVDAHTFVGILRIGYDSLTLEKIPDDFSLQMEITRVTGLYIPDGETDTQRYRMLGSWLFSELPFEKSNEDMQTVEINETNEEGIGLAYIELSPMELTLHTIEPADCLTFAVVLDKDGRKLINGSSNAYELAVNGHDISAFTVYICDYNEYMDEIKAYNLIDEGVGLQDILEEKALYKRTISP